MTRTSLCVGRAIEGDTDSTQWLTDRFRPFLESQIRMRTGGAASPHDIEDLVAEVWAVMLSRLQDLEARDGRLTPVFVRFLGTTAVHLCNHFLRDKIRAEAAVGGATGVDREPIEVADRSTRGVVSRVAEGELCARIRACLEQMQGNARDVLVMRLLEHRTNLEIAAELGIPANTVAVRYRRALEELRRGLPRELFGDVLEWTGRPGRG